MNPNIININNGKVLTDPRYGAIVALDAPGSAPLDKIDLAVASVFPNATSPAHYHQQTEEIYFITEGVGEMIIDGVTMPIGAGDCIRIPTYTIHGIRAGNAGVKFVVVTSPPYCINDDFEVNTTTVERPVRSTGGIAIIIGTHRRQAVSAKIARQIAGMYADLGVETDLIDPAQLPLEFFHSDSFDHRYETDSPLTQRLIKAKAFHICVSEYNGSFSGVIKHLLDVQPYKECFDGKPTAMVGVAAGDFGAIRAVDQLAAVFSYRQSHIFAKRVFIKNVDEMPFDENGLLTEPEIVSRLRAQVAEFTDFVRRLSA